MSEPAQGSALERLRRLEQPARARPPGRRGIAGGVLGGLAVLLAKGKAIGFLLLTKLKLLFVVLKLGKLLTTGWTMIFAAGVYASYYGWSFALGLVLLVLVHEMGHGLAARAMGMPVGAPVFIPFLGAFIALQRRPRSTWEDFVIAAGGPLVGGLAGAGCVVVGVLAGQGLLVALGYFALVMNLFNLTPFWTLDGARMLGPVGWRAGLAGAAFALVALLVAAAASGHVNPIALIAVAVAGGQLGRRAWRERRAPAPRTALERLAAQDTTVVPDLATPAQRRTATLVYFGLLTTLGVAVHLLQARLPST